MRLKVLYVHAYGVLGGTLSVYVMQNRTYEILHVLNLQLVATSFIRSDRAISSLCIMPIIHHRPHFEAADPAHHQST